MRVCQKFNTLCSLPDLGSTALLQSVFFLSLIINKNNSLVLCQLTTSESKSIFHLLCLHKIGITNNTNTRRMVVSHTLKPHILSTKTLPFCSITIKISKSIPLRIKVCEFLPKSHSLYKQNPHILRNPTF